MESLKKLEDYQDEEVQREKFVVDTKEKANWVVRKIAHIQKQLDENGEIAKAEIEKLWVWLDKEGDKLKEDIEWLTFMAEPWFRKLNKESDGKVKTMKFPDGEIRIRKQQTKYTIDDEKLLCFFKSTGRQELIKIKEIPDWGTFKKQTVVADGTKVIVEGTGEVVDGAGAEERGDKFEIVTNQKGGK